MVVPRGKGHRPGPLTFGRHHGVYLSHAHARPPLRSLVAHLLKGGPCDFFSRNRRKAATQCRSEEHTSELQSRENLVCRLLLEKKKKNNKKKTHKKKKQKQKKKRK